MSLDTPKARVAPPPWLTYFLKIMNFVITNNNNISEKNEPWKFTLNLAHEEKNWPYKETINPSFDQYGTPNTLCTPKHDYCNYLRIWRPNIGKQSNKNECHSDTMWKVDLKPNLIRKVITSLVIGSRKHKQYWIKWDERSTKLLFDKSLSTSFDHYKHIWGIQRCVNRPTLIKSKFG